MKLSADEEETLNQFRERVTHLIPESFKPDHELSRWLIARNFSLDKAEAMLLKSLKWRKSWEVDDIMDWKIPEALDKYIPRAMIGFDKEGCPVWILPYGGKYLRQVLQSAPYKDFIKLMIYSLEMTRLEIKKQSDKLGKTLQKTSVIFDFDGLALDDLMWRPAKYLFLDMLRIYEANYPEFLHKAFIINVPTVFWVGFNLLKPFLAEQTLKKINIHSKTGWQEEMFQYIPKDQIPKFYGGSMVDQNGDPKCSALINYAEEVPTSYFIHENIQSLTTDAKHKVVTVRRKSKEVIKIKVEIPETEIKWKFLCEEFDIGFGLSFSPDSDAKEEKILISIHRVNAQLVPDKGSILCTQAGTYKIIFDNEFSQWRSKKVVYNIEVIEPK